MAPKGQPTATSAPKVVQDVALVKIEDVSVENDSGWRPVDPGRVKELVSLFLSGQYGIGLLRPPSIIQQSGAPKNASDGRQCLSDGKQTMCALAKVKQIYEDADQCEAHEWTTPLVEALTNCGRVSVVEYPEDDLDLVVAYNVLVHDVDSNKYKSTSIQDMAAVAERFRAKAQLKKHLQRNQVAPESKRSVPWRPNC